MKITVIFTQALGCNTGNNESKVARGWAKRKTDDAVTCHISFYSNYRDFKDSAMLPFSVVHSYGSLNLGPGSLAINDGTVSSKRGPENGYKGRLVRERP